MSETGIFVAVAASDSAVSADQHSHYVCGACIADHRPRIDLADDRTQVWEVGSDGWLGPIECMDCSRAIEVTVGADRDCPECGAVGPHLPAGQRFSCSACGATFDAY